MAATEKPAAWGRLRVAWGVTLLVLIGATWPLWTPLGAAPRLPLPGPLAIVPPALDFVLLAIVTAATIAALVDVKNASRRAMVATMALAALMACDQLRWQPWAYHALLIGVLLATCDARCGVRLAQWLTISVYVYSAMSKFDAAFFATLGQQFLATPAQWMGVDTRAWPESLRRWAAAILPAGELAVGTLLGVSLQCQSVARVGVVAALLMHFGIVAILGPWGLDHSWGVLLWNLGFAWQTCVLFTPGKSAEAESPESRTLWPSRLATGVILVAIVAPLFSPLGWWDHWPSWGLYAPGGERAAVLVHRSVWSVLPAKLREASGDDDGAEWRRARIDRWLLQENLAPVYPQNRIVLALAASLANRYPLWGRIRVVAETRADLITGERESETLDGAEAIRAAARWLGAQPVVTWP